MIERVHTRDIMVKNFMLRWVRKLAYLYVRSDSYNKSQSALLDNILFIARAWRLIIWVSVNVTRTLEREEQSPTTSRYRNYSQPEKMKFSIPVSVKSSNTCHSTAKNARSPTVMKYEVKADVERPDTTDCARIIEANLVGYLRHVFCWLLN